MGRFFSKVYCLLLIVFCLLFTTVKGQNLCSNATALCANNTIASTTVGATVSAGDPALSCGDATLNNNVWFTVKAISNGSCTVTVSNIHNNPGLAMEAYTGSCGSLVTTGACNSANGPSGSMNITFAVTAGTTYYIMVDGQAGDQESFHIAATSGTGSILGRPQPSFIPTTLSGCPPPLSDSLQNTTILSGGSNITYQWRIDGGSYLNASGSDTTVTFNTTGTHSVDLKVCNLECGCASATQFIDVEVLTASITPPANICIGSSADFSGDAFYSPSGDPANVGDWEWIFGDPLSGSNDTAHGQTASHTFVGSGPTFVVTLIVSSIDCGNDTVTTTVTTHPKPTVNAGADQRLCEGTDATLTAVTSNATAPISYQWFGVGIFSCDTCQTTTVSGLPAGGPYNISIHIQDANGCTADSSVNISINPKPVVDLGNDTTVCRYSPVQLNANVTTGTPPFTYAWNPSYGLSDSTIQNPIATVSVSTQFCVLVRDTIGCPSDTTCINVNVYTSSLVIGSPKALCASDPNLNTTFTVSGANPGSTYQWYLSPDFPKIDSASVDSSTIRASFPTGVATTYHFTCIVTDGVTGCVDTVSIAYDVVSGLNMTLTPSVTICQGDTVTLVATGANTYTWTANPAYAFADSTLDTQVVWPSTTATFTVQGNIGSCTEVMSDTVTVNSKPIISVLSDSTICPNSPTRLFAIVTSGGTAPFNYSWLPAAGLDSSNVYDPLATISSTTQYCTVVTDSNNCKSDTGCVTLTVYPPMSLSTSPSTLCSTDTLMQSVFTVNGASSGSSYQWYLSPDYSLITGSNVDSSSVTVTFPQGVVSTYHFTVVVIDSITGCHDTIFQSFSVTAGLNMTVSGQNKICLGQSTTLIAGGATTYTWTASPAYAFGNPNAATQTVSPVVTTTFTITGATGTCTEIITDTVTVNAKPTAVAAPIPLFCGCDTVTLDGSASTGANSYNWTSTGGNTVDSLDKVIATSFLCARDSFVLIVMDTATSCGDTTSVVANQKAKPAATATISPNTICGGTSTTVLLDGTGSDANSGTTYLWTSNNLNAIFADSSAISTTATVDTATIFFLTVTDSSGCDSTFSVTLNSSPKLIVNAGGDQTICEGDSAHLIAVVNNPPVTWQWSSGAGTITCDTCQSTYINNLPAPGPYNISILVIDTNGCSADTSLNILVNQGPTITVSNDTTVCSYSPVQLNVTVTSLNPPPFTYLWTPSAGLNNDTIANPIAIVNATSNYCVVVKDSVGCSSPTACVNINIFPKPTIAAAPATTCASDPNPQTILTVNGASSGSTYSWTLSPDYSLIDSASTDSSVVRATFPQGIVATYQFAVVVNDSATGCQDTVFQSFSVTSGLNMTVSGKNTICPGQSTTLSANGATTYNWTASPAYAFANPNDSVQTVSPVVTTIFTITGVTGACTEVITDTVTVNAKPIAVASPIPLSCGCSTVTLNGTSSTGGNSYSWTSTGGNTVDSSNLVIATSFICSRDSFVLIVMDTATACGDTTSVIANEKPKPADTASIAPNRICGGVSTTVFLDGTGSDTTSGTTYLWTSNNLNAIFADSSALITTATVDTTTVFSLTVTDSSGCDSTFSITLNASPKLVVNVGGDQTICEGDSAHLMAVVNNPPVTWQWSSGVGNITCDTCQSTYINNLPAPGPYNISISVTDTNGCTADTSLNIFVNQGPTVTVNNDTTVCAYSSVQLNVTVTSSNPPPFTYLWTSSSPSATLNNDTIANPIATVTDSSASFCVVVKDSIGCSSSTACVTVNLFPKPNITATPSLVCSSNSNPQTIFTVSAGGGSVYSWILSPDYPRIDSASFDSSSVRATFPTGIVGTYNFTCIVNDGVTGCTDTVATSFSVILGPSDTITGSSKACANDSAMYIVSPGAGIINWISNGGIILQGQGTDTVFIQWTSVGMDTLSVTDSIASSGCVGTTSIFVTVGTPPVTSLTGGPDSVCLNSITTYTAASHVNSVYNWTLPNGGGTIIGTNTLDSVSIQWDSVGVWAINVNETDTSTGCIGAIIADTVTVLPLPSAPLITGDTTVCNNIDTIYTVPFTIGSAYNWTVNSGTLVSGQGTDTIHVNWSVPGNQLISVVETNQYGCSSPAGTLSVAVDTLPDATALPDTATICQSDSLIINGSVNISSGIIHWLTSGNGTFSDTTIASPVYHPGNLDSSVTLSMVLTSACGSDTALIVLTVNPSPTITITAIPDSIICFGDSVTLIASGALTYLWNTGPTTDSIVVNPIGTTTFAVVGTSSFNCKTSDSITITVNPLPTINAVTGPTTVCVNDSASYVANPTAGNYTWSIFGGTIISGQFTDSVFVTWDSLGTDTLIVVNSNASGCTSTDTVFVLANAPPVTSAVSGPDSVCTNDTVTYIVAYHAGATYHWITLAGNIVGNATGDTIQVVWSTSGVDYIFVNETNSSGCSSALVTDTILIFASPSVPQITGADSACAGDSALYYVLSNSDVTFNWTVAGGTILNGQGSDSVLVLWSTSGKDTVSITETSIYGCGSVTTLDSVFVNPIPQIIVAPHDSTICRNSSLQIIGIANYATSHWTTSGTGTFSDTSIASPIYIPGANDTGLVILTVVLSSPCGNDTDFVNLTVLPSPVITLSANPSNAICKGDTVLLVATGGPAYSWSTGASTDSIPVNPVDTTTYSVTVTNSSNCSVTDSITVAVIPIAISNAGSDQLVCRTDSVFLNGSYANAGGLIWSTLGDGHFTDTLSGITTYLPGRNDTVNGSVLLIVTSTGACRNSSDTVVITFGGRPTAYAGRDTTLTGGPNSGATVPLNGTIANANSIQWTTSGTGTFSPNDTSLIGTYIPTTDDYKKDSVTITLTATGPCGTTTSYFIIDFTVFTIPNIITPYPNSPGVNDFFEIISLPPGSKLQIWDRWGLLVYTSDNYQNDWDAHGLTADEFYYILETRQRKYYGWVLVLR